MVASLAPCFPLRPIKIRLYLDISLHLLLHRRAKATNASPAMQQPAAGVQSQRPIPRSSHKEQMETVAWTSKCCCIIGTNQKRPAIFHSRHSFIFFFLFVFFPCSHRSSEAGAAQPGDAAQDQSKAGAAGNGAAQAVWNPFDDDTFSSLPAEEVKHEDKKPAGTKAHTGGARCARVNANSSEGPGIKTAPSPFQTHRRNRSKHPAWS